MRIWVDADACPAVIKDILYRAAERTKIPMTLVANKLLRVPASPYIRALQVPHALNPRGEFYSTENIQERLALRTYLDELRGLGERTGGPAALDNTDRKRFADQLDRFLAKVRRE